MDFFVLVKIKIGLDQLRKRWLHWIWMSCIALKSYLPVNIRFSILTSLSCSLQQIGSNINFNILSRYKLAEQIHSVFLFWKLSNFFRSAQEGDQISDP